MNQNHHPHKEQIVKKTQRCLSPIIHSLSQQKRLKVYFSYQTSINNLSKKVSATQIKKTTNQQSYQPIISPFKQVENKQVSIESGSIFKNQQPIRKYSFKSAQTNKRTKRLKIFSYKQNKKDAQQCILQHVDYHQVTSGVQTIADRLDDFNQQLKPFYQQNQQHNYQQNQQLNYQKKQQPNYQQNQQHNNQQQKQDTLQFTNPIKNKLQFIRQNIKNKTQNLQLINSKQNDQNQNQQSKFMVYDQNQIEINSNKTSLISKYKDSHNNKNIVQKKHKSKSNNRRRISSKISPSKMILNNQNKKANNQYLRNRIQSEVINVQLYPQSQIYSLQRMLDQINNKQIRTIRPSIQQKAASINRNIYNMGKTNIIETENITGKTPNVEKYSNKIKKTRERTKQSDNLLSQQYIRLDVNQKCDAHYKVSNIRQTNRISNYSNRHSTIKVTPIAISQYDKYQDPIKQVVRASNYYKSLISQKTQSNKNPLSIRFYDDTNEKSQRSIQNYKVARKINRNLSIQSQYNNVHSNYKTIDALDNQQKQKIQLIKTKNKQIQQGNQLNQSNIYNKLNKLNQFNTCNQLSAYNQLSVCNQLNTIHQSSKINQLNKVKHNDQNRRNGVRYKANQFITSLYKTFISLIRKENRPQLEIKQATTSQLQRKQSPIKQTIVQKVSKFWRIKKQYFLFVFILLLGITIFSVQFMDIGKN